MNPPSATYLLDNYRFNWPIEGVEITADRIHEDKSGLLCELTVSTSLEPYSGLLRQGRFNMSAPQTRSQWEKALNERLPDVDWYSAFESVCALSVRRWREGEPVLDLACVEERQGLPYLLYPFVVEGAASILFAEGGSGKSLMALAAGLSVATGEAVLGVSPQRLGPVLYLDWEWDEQTHSERLRALCRGLEMDVPEGMIWYRHETASVIESASTIRRRIAEIGAAMVVVDSLGMARGGEPESAELTIKTFATFRSFGVPVLALDHVAKNATDKKHSFGSVYTTNAARITWRMEAAKEDRSESYRIGLTNQKANGKYQKPRGYEVQIDTDDDERMLCVRYVKTDISNLPGFEGSVPLYAQIERVLTQPMAFGDLHTALQLAGSTVSKDVLTATLTRNKGRRFTQTGLGMWVRLDRERVSE